MDVSVKIHKRLRKKKFSMLESAIACSAFIVYGLICDLFLRFIPLNFALAIFMMVLVEAVFAFASMTASAISSVEFLEAEDLNKKIDYKTALLAVGVSLVCLFGFNGLTNVFVNILGEVGYTQQISNITIPNFGFYILYVILYCLVPAVCEEICFRGCILNGFKNQMSKHKAVVLSALIFMLMHGGPDQTIHQFILGIVLGYVFIYSGSLWTTIIIHFMNNFIAITMIYLTPASASEEVVEKMSAMQWVSNILVALVMAGIAGYIIYYLLRFFKKFREEREQKQLLEKAKTSEENLQTNDEPTSINVEVLDGEKEKRLERDKKYITIALFSASFAYLVFEWILTLVRGIIA